MPKVTICIVVKDEAEGLRKIIRLVKPYGQEIIVVDGHSKDNTKDIAKSENVTYLLDHNLGRGDGVRCGIQAAKGEIIVFFDADGQPQVRDIPKLLSPILNKKADLVLASRRKGGSFDSETNLTGFVRSVGSDILTMLVNQKFKTNLTDILYSFRAINTTKAKKLSLLANDFRIEQEMVVSSLRLGYKVMEIPSREKQRAWGKSKLKTIMGIPFLLSLIKDLYFH